MLPDGKMERLQELIEKHTALVCQIGG